MIKETLIMRKYNSIYNEVVLISKKSRNDWANRTFSKELKDLEENDIVWLQDKALRYHGYYLVTKEGFEYLDTYLTQSIFKKYNKEDKDVQILTENNKKKPIYKESHLMNSGKCVLKFLELLSQVRLYHWQTFGYAEHVALGNYYDAMSDLIDGFIESYQGQYGREFISFDGMPQNISVCDMHEQYPIKQYIDEVSEYLKSFRTNLEGHSNTALQNMVDEMIGETDKLRYLLTLE